MCLRVFPSPSAAHRIMCGVCVSVCVHTALSRALLLWYGKACVRSAHTHTPLQHITHSVLRGSARALGKRACGGKRMGIRAFARACVNIYRDELHTTTVSASPRADRERESVVSGGFSNSRIIYIYTSSRTDTYILYIYISVCMCIRKLGRLCAYCTLTHMCGVLRRTWNACVHVYAFRMM